MATANNRFRKADEAHQDAVVVELWLDHNEIRGSVCCPAKGLSDARVSFVPPQAGMSGQEALATACHFANLEGREVVIMDPTNLWRAEWGTLQP